MNVYEVITDRIVKALEAGVAPWRQPWASKGMSAMPKNLVSKKEYRGVNILLTATQGYQSPFWCTYKQATSLGGNVRKGEKSTPCVFWKRVDKKGGKVSASGKKEQSFILRYYNIFNVSQCENLKVPSTPAPAPDAKEVNPIQACEDLVKLYKTIPRVNHGGSRAYYSPDFDHIGMPVMADFHGAEEYYSTLFHELVHSTGHKDRLNRDGVTNPIHFGSHDYSFEELVAECGSAFLCGKAGIENRVIENQAAYIGSWLKKLKSEPRWLVEAAGKAQRAADYILGHDPTKVEESEEEEAE